MCGAVELQTAMYSVDWGRSVPVEVCFWRRRESRDVKYLIFLFSFEFVLVDYRCSAMVYTNFFLARKPDAMLSPVRDSTELARLVVCRKVRKPHKAAQCVILSSLDVEEEKTLFQNLFQRGEYSPA